MFTQILWDAFCVTYLLPKGGIGHLSFSMIIAIPWWGFANLLLNRAARPQPKLLSNAEKKPITFCFNTVFHLHMLRLERSFFAHSSITSPLCQDLCFEFNKNFEWHFRLTFRPSLRGPSLKSGQWRRPTRDRWRPTTGPFIRAMPLKVSSSAELYDCS